MKKIIVIILILIGNFTNAQSNLTIFNNGGQQFYVILNGIKQNSVPQTNVVVSQIKNGAYSVKLIFADGKTGDIDKNFFIDAPSDITTKVTFKKGQGKLQLVSMIPTAGGQMAGSVTYRPDNSYNFSDAQVTGSNVSGNGNSSQSNINSSSTNTIATQSNNGSNQSINTNANVSGNSTGITNNGNSQTSTTTVTTTNNTTPNGNGNVNMNLNMGGTGMNVTVNDPLSGGNVNLNMNLGINGNVNSTSSSSQTTTVTTTTTSSSTTNGVTTHQNSSSSNTTTSGNPNNNLSVNTNVSVPSNGSVSVNGTNSNLTSNQNINSNTNNINTNNSNSSSSQIVTSANNSNGSFIVCKRSLGDLNGFLNDIKSQTFEDDRIEIIKKDLEFTCVTSQQAYKIIEILTFEANRMDVAQYLYFRTSDRQNSDKGMLPLFTFDSSKMDWRDFVRQANN